METAKPSARQENLTGKTFGNLLVLYPAPDHITSSGQKKKCWVCKCQLCGKETIVPAQNLKKGTAKSCGCLQAYKGKANRNKRTCVICGREFECPPSSKTVTCSSECRKEYARRRSTGRVFTQEAREKISEKAKGRNMADLQAIAVAAAKKSPKSGRFVTNRNAIDWHLVSPDGRHYYFHSLNNWIRENGEELFGCRPDTQKFLNAISGLQGAKRATLGKNYGSCTYKGWRVIPTEDDNKSSETKEEQENENKDL